MAKKRKFLPGLTKAVKSVTGDGVLPALGRVTGIQSKATYDRRQALKSTKLDEAKANANITKGVSDMQDLANKELANDVNAASNPSATPAPNKKLMLYGGIAAGVLLVVIILVVVLKGRG